MNIFDIIQVPFGYLISFVYSLTHSYTISILAFAIVVKIVLFPLGIKQQKNMQKQAALRPKEERIRKKYAGRTDRVTQQKMQTEIMEMYQEEKYSPFSGCLPMILQLVVLLCLYSVVRYPMTYVAHMNQTQVDQVHAVVTEMKNVEEAADPAVTQPATAEAPDSSVPATSSGNNNQNSYYSQIQDLSYINEHEEEFRVAYDAQYGAGASGEFADKLPRLRLFGFIDLGVIPSEAGLLTIHTLFALISLLSAYLGQMITRKFTYQSPVNADANAQSSMKIMNFAMPLFSGYISYAMVPLAVTIYWIATNLLSPVQQIVLSKMYKVPTFTPEELKEAEKALAKNEPKKKADENLPKRRSLVYDDDEDDAAPAENKGGSGLKEKARSDDSPIEKARLKDESDENNKE